MRFLGSTLGVGLALVLFAAPEAALPAPESSLYVCQLTAGKEGEKFVKGQIKYVDVCLKKIANEIIKKNNANAANAAKVCVKMFRKLNDSRGLGKSVGEKFTAKVQSKCDPAVNEHTIDDITGKGAPGVAEQIETQIVDAWCQHFGGDGSIDTLQEWMDCIVASHMCEANQAIAAEYPRAPEWLDLVRPDMVALPPSDPNEVTDALAALDAVNAAIDSDGDDLPDIFCGGVSACKTTCCYMEDLAIPPETGCVEYTGTPAQDAAFAATCFGPSLPAGAWMYTPVPGPCVAGPIFLTPCAVGLPNHVLVPKDSSCP